MVQMLEYYENAQPPFTEDEKKAMDELRDLFALNPKINFQTDDYFLTKFLRVYDWNAQAAYDAIVFLYELKVIELKIDEQRLFSFDMFVCGCVIN